MDILIIMKRTFIFYFIILIAYRLMGKREIAKLGIIDLIISILIAELVAMSIENLNDSIIKTILPIFTLVFMEMLLAYLSTKFKTLRYLLEGKAAVIINNGKINYKEMVKNRYSLDDLLLQLRQDSIKDIKDIEYAFLENNGKLSIFKYENNKKRSDYPFPIILDGRVEYESLAYINKDIMWLNKELSKKELRIRDIFYAFYKNSRIIIIKKEEVL